MYDYFWFYYVYCWYNHYYFEGSSYCLLDVFILLFVTILIPIGMVRSSKTRVSLDRSGISTQDSMSNQTSYSYNSSPDTKNKSDASILTSKQARKDNKETSLMIDYDIPKIRQKKSWKTLSPYSKQLLLHYVRRAKK